jgi:cyclohexyl-isocyanide hydratase
MKVQALIFPGMTTIDVIGPLQPMAFGLGAEITPVWKEAGPVETDCGVPLVAKASFKDADPNPDVLVVPGGGAPAIDQMEDQEVLDFLADRGAKAEWIVSVCTGSLLLGAAGLLKGYKAATYWSLMDELALFGAIPTPERVVMDRNRCTGGGVTAGVDVGVAMVGQIAGEDMGKAIELMLEYNPAPPYGTGHPTTAGEALVAHLRPRVDESLSPARVQAIAKKQAAA